MMLGSKQKTESKENLRRKYLPHNTEFFFTSGEFGLSLVRINTPCNSAESLAASSSLFIKSSSLSTSAGIPEADIVGNLGTNERGLLSLFSDVYEKVVPS